ncbi:Rab5c [Salpingoeca rosetta]|uniref:Rab5c n=1 Tax=Salpingoeca rosetta (strain ATCC 50818 / BSB-021) TaxID=946362 RepID=F2UKZ6_SALR5|nr:Rab5c [Salpingoeca rosetta]EGD77795.1 Rab5c [Salpingoeca rosetta]|eukprot:XP_004990271.1 Rab5c [Salpingoeca rosetta]
MPRPENVKLVLLGASGVGKSSLVLRFVRDEFRDHHEITVGAAFLSKVVDLPNSRQIKLEIWDTAGQERYRSLAPMYYRGAQGAIVVFDITQHDSFASAREWIKELWSHTEEDKEKPLVVLVGNKVDKSNERQVNPADVQAFTQANNITYMETSAKTAVNTSRVFEYIAEELVKRRASSDSDDDTSVDLDQPQSSGGCC